jgi:hypothetical protein
LISTGPRVLGLAGGVCWPIGSFSGGSLERDDAGVYRLCDAHGYADDTGFPPIILRPEAVAAALFGSLEDDEYGYDTVEVRLDPAEYERVSIEGAYELISTMREVVVNDNAAEAALDGLL